jgi:hypothetical protein
VIKLDPEGKLLGRWGRRGTGTHEISNPAALAIGKNSRVYILARNYPSTPTNRLLIFDSTGNFINQLELFGVRYATHFAIDPKGYVYVTELSSDIVWKVGPVPP